MDSGLIAWARQVKRQCERRGDKHSVPLWFFTDDQRLPDPFPVIRALPPRLSGVLLRHDAHSTRPALAAAIARLCRQREIALIIAGDAKLARSLQAGLHLRGGACLRPQGWSGGVLSASVHNSTQLRQARRAKVRLVFISPVFMTASHPGVATLGNGGWRRLAKQTGGQIKPYALGGVNGKNARSLGPLCVGAGAIDAFFRA